MFDQIETEGEPEGPDSGIGQRAQRRLEGIGATLAEQILPEAIRRRLRAVVDQRDSSEQEAKEQPPTLWVVSNEPWVPWELLRLCAEDDPRGPFLGEAFALVRWLWDVQPVAGLPLGRLGLVAPAHSGLPEAAEEGRVLKQLAEASGRLVDDITPRYEPLLHALGSAGRNGWHFVGHGWAEDGAPDLWTLELDGDEMLRPVDLRSSTVDLRADRPLVFLNACRSARMDLSLSGIGGFASAFLNAGAGAFLGTHWNAGDRSGREFAVEFYRRVFDGSSLAEAARAARLHLRNKNPADPSWLAYTLFAHPTTSAHPQTTSSAAVALAVVEHLSPPRWPGEYLEIPFQDWLEDSSPGALLRADHGVVPFHRRVEELAELRAWCEAENPLRIHLLTGAGGMGKTRLALEICLAMREEGWRSGFIPREVDSRVDEMARAVAAAGGPTLLVLDYAETRREPLLALVREIDTQIDRGPFRILLLSRQRHGWWRKLRNAPGRLGDLVMGTATHRALGPLAQAEAERTETYRTARDAFAERLGRSLQWGDLPKDLAASHFDPVLMIHIAALGQVEGTRLRGEDGILDWLLARERKFWRNQVHDADLDESLVDGLEQVMAVVTLAGGTTDQQGTLQLLRSLRYFRGTPEPTLVTLSWILHATYPGEHWINPLLPDLLGEHLLEHVRRDPEIQREIHELVFGDAELESGGATDCESV